MRLVSHSVVVPLTGLKEMSWFELLFDLEYWRRGLKEETAAVAAAYVGRNVVSPPGSLIGTSMQAGNNK